MLNSFRLDRLITLYGLVPFLSHQWARKPFLPILMYHSISDDPENGVHGYYRLNTSIARFREQMFWLKEHGYATVNLAEGLKYLKINNTNQIGSDQNRKVVLTFDDGYADFLTNAWPILAELDMSATVYLPTSFIGKQSKIFKGRKCLTWRQVLELYDQGIFLGTHTANHVQLHDLSWPDIEKELLDSRRCLENQLGHPVHEFAYPYAYPSADHSFCKRLNTSLQSCGYQYGVNTMIGTVTYGDDNMRLKRLPVNDADDMTFFKAKLEGMYNWLETGQKTVKAVKNLIHF
jgi:peptidoglycan/xylan/chitin deacetylase (PgdA/CDA1 family)